jgi:Uma2 family endonuclease
LIRVQDPVRLAVDSEPQPDIVVVRLREDFYRLRHPGPEEVLLLVEVADSSLEFEREVKVPLYAKAGISETWIVDVKGSSVEVFRRPIAGSYEVHHVLKAGDILVPERLPNLLLTANDILPA